MKRLFNILIHWSCGVVCGLLSGVIVLAVVIFIDRAYVSHSKTVQEAIKLQQEQLNKQKPHLQQ